ncbi:hypothetical protein BGZ63DRAFT_360178 [Mariannaea sp. PMI_226]|nr:hypothetical protein BGZ63DRAFT_360178 [Mariannaea sp. PMI_226]
MATLDSLKKALRQKAASMASSPAQPLSDTQYSAGFDIFSQDSGWAAYRDFIIPQLSQLLAPLFSSRAKLSVLEIGPGSKSVLGHLPDYLKYKIGRYAAFEPNSLFATKLEDWLGSGSSKELPLPSLDSPPEVFRLPFVLNSNARSSTSDGIGTFDIILFCHSMYGMKPKRKFIEQALEMLVKKPEGGMVVVFHREESLRLDGLACHRTASFPTGVIRVADEDEVLDCFSSFITGSAMQDADVDKAIQVEWRKICRALGRREETSPKNLLFSSPEIMVAFTQHATMLWELAAQVPLVNERKMVKNREARRHHPASTFRPTEIHHVQQCVQWALKHQVGLTIIGGGHSGHCLWPNVVSVDMGAFDQVHIVATEDEGERPGSNPESLIVAEAGCTTGDIVRKTMAAGLTVPLGARPSVGAGLWLQGGIGHLARPYGLTCDAIVGAVVVSIESGQLLYVGNVPSHHRPVNAVRPENENDLLWALKGAGNNFCIVVSITFKAYPAPTYSVRNLVVPLSDDLDARSRLTKFAEFAQTLTRNYSADAYLYWDNKQLHLGVTTVGSTTTGNPIETDIPVAIGPASEGEPKTVDGVGLFETEMYISGMHGGHGGGKTSSFKRCLFLKHLEAVNVTDILAAALRTRPSPFCYLHLLHGGGAVGDVAGDATAFGCRDWDFACVITGVWLRDQDGSETARAAVDWVYNVARDLLPLATGAYGADLGPDPRDAAFAAKAFGPNQLRLARLKHKFDPHNMLAYACPLPKPPGRQKLILLVTGESCAGKDFCSDIWVSVFTDKNIRARAVSISDATKREYAAATGADLPRLLWDRTYKEHHRQALTTFFQDQVQKRPRLPEEHFLRVVSEAADTDVLLITGMRDEAPVAAFSHLVPDSRLLEVRVVTSKETLEARQGCQGSAYDGDDNKGSNQSTPNSTATANYSPNFIFNNDTIGKEAAKTFAENFLLPYCHDDLHRLASMVRQVPSFPRSGIEFRHVLGISQELGGLRLCTSLLQAQFAGDWANVGAVACCEAGGFVFASALAAQINVPLALIREAGKLPPPTICVPKCSSHVSSLAGKAPKEKMVEIEPDVLPKGASVVVVDDVLATGETLCAVLQLLGRAGISAENTSVMVVAEFPVHRGRDLLYRRGFGNIRIQSLLVFGGV